MVDAPGDAGSASVPAETGCRPDRQVDRIDVHLLLTDSGLGGVSICAGLERSFRLAGGGRRVRLTYFNAAPDSRGYNSLPGMETRARAFDRALEAMDRYHPDLIVLACNTLSVLYDRTEHSRRSPVPVVGIIEIGVRLFSGALAADPGGDLVLLGTRTTIESGAHRDGLIGRGIEPGRIAAIPCHGLAAAIELGPDAPDVERLIAECAAEAGQRDLPGRTIYAGLACTHYAFVRDRIRSALERVTGKTVRILDPNGMLVDALVPGADRRPGDDEMPRGLRGGIFGGYTEGLCSDIDIAFLRTTGPGKRSDSRARTADVLERSSPLPADGEPERQDRPWPDEIPDRAPGIVIVDVVSKVPLDDDKRRAMAGLIEPVSGLTARALLAYTCDPTLF